MPEVSSSPASTMPASHPDGLLTVHDNGTRASEHPAPRLQYRYVDQYRHEEQQVTDPRVTLPPAVGREMLAGGDWVMSWATTT